MARIQAVLRRGGVADEALIAEDVQVVEQVESITAENLFIDPERREVKCCGVPVNLSRKEFDLLTIMVTNRGRVFDRQTLLSRVWGEDCYVDDRTVDVHIRWLREKIESTPARPELILTVRGIGYKFKG
jgi:DNA-binding response OmpR family regulator